MNKQKSMRGGKSIRKNIGKAVRNNVGRNDGECTERNIRGKITAAAAICTMVLLAGCQSAVKTDEASLEPAQTEAVDADAQLNMENQSNRSNEDGQSSQSKVNDQMAQANTGSQDVQPDQDDAQAETDGSINLENNINITKARKQPPTGWELTLASEDWGLSFGEAGTQPIGNALPEDLAWYDAYYVGNDDEKVIYLTFDCGYENGNTEPILDALKKHDVKATFFVVGHFLETAPDLAKRMTEEGHAVGNHTYHHLDMPTISDMETFQKEMDDVAALFNEITGEKLSPYYRPPQGKCNVNNLKMAQELGYNTIFWSLAYVDWNQDSQPDHEEALDKLTTRIHPGAIVLLHNTSTTNGEILDVLLTKWEEMGYIFKPLSELVSRDEE